LVNNQNLTNPTNTSTDPSLTTLSLQGLEPKEAFGGKEHDVAAVLTHYAPFPEGVQDVKAATEALIQGLGDRLARFVTRGEPVSLFGPAFAFKSPVNAKAIEEKADVAEATALKSVADLARDIQQVYQPGSRFTLFQDGHPFVPILKGHSEEATDAYLKDVRRIKDIVAGDQAGAISIPTARDFIDATNLEDLRAKFLDRYGDTDIEKVKQRVKQTPALEKDKLGLKTFYEYVFKYLKSLGHPDFEGMSGSAIQREAKEVAYGMIQTREGWNNLGIQHSPEGSVRVSFTLGDTPTPNKLGLLMGTDPKRWLTPWHATPVTVEPSVGKKETFLSKAMYATRVGFVPRKDEHGLNYMGFPDSVANNPAKQAEMVRLLKQLRPGADIEAIMAGYQKP
jgi:pyoverdine/dityrosine biosynthesis protein Dit1